VLHGLLHSYEQGDLNAKGKQREVGERPDDEGTAAQSAAEAGPSRQPTKAVYEFVQDGGRIEPRLRLWVSTASTEDEVSAAGTAGGAQQDDPRVAIFLDKPESQPPSPECDSRSEDLLLVSKPVAQKGQSLVWSLQRKSSKISQSENTWEGTGDSDASLETSAHPVELLCNWCVCPSGPYAIIQYRYYLKCSEVAKRLPRINYFVGVRYRILPTLTGHTRVSLCASGLCENTVYSKPTGIIHEYIEDRTSAFFGVAFIQTGIFVQ